LSQITRRSIVASGLALPSLARAQTGLTEIRFCLAGGMLVTDLPETAA